MGAVHGAQPQVRGSAAPAASELTRLAGPSSPARAATHPPTSTPSLRSFAQPGRHVWVPGIDMANHTLAPNADIRWVGG